MAKGSDSPIRFRLPSEELQLDQRWVGQKTLVGFFPWSWSTCFTMSSKGMGAAWLWLVDGSTLFSRRGSCKTSLKTTILRWNGIIFCWLLTNIDQLVRKKKHQNPRMYQHFPNQSGNVGYTSLKKARSTSHYSLVKSLCFTLKTPS